MDPLQGNSGFLEVRATALETILVQGDLAQGISVTAEPTMVRATSGKSYVLMATCTKEQGSKVGDPTLASIQAKRTGKGQL